MKWIEISLIYQYVREREEIQREGERRDSEGGREKRFRGRDRKDSEGERKRKQCERERKRNNLREREERIRRERKNWRMYQTKIVFVCNLFSCHSQFCSNCTQSFFSTKGLCVTDSATNICNLEAINSNERRRRKKAGRERGICNQIRADCYVWILSSPLLSLPTLCVSTNGTFVINHTRFEGILLLFLSLSLSFFLFSLSLSLSFSLFQSFCLFLSLSFNLFVSLSLSISSSLPLSPSISTMLTIVYSFNFVCIHTVPIAPSQSSFLKLVNASCLSLNFNEWQSGGCFIKFFMVSFKADSSRDWSALSSPISGDTSKYLINDLTIDSWYRVKVSATNDAGSTEAEYTFSTSLTNDGRGILSHLGASGSTIIDAPNSDAESTVWFGIVLLPILTTTIILACIGFVVFNFKRKQNHDSFNHRHHHPSLRGKSYFSSKSVEVLVFEILS